MHTAWTLQHLLGRSEYLSGSMHTPSNTHYRTLPKTHKFSSAQFFPAAACIGASALPFFIQQHPGARTVYVPDRQQQLSHTRVQCPARVVICASLLCHPCEAAGSP